jgi:excinuclease ABC subunit B
MYHGDRSRKQTLVNYGFRLPSALDNRPLNFAEFCQRIPQVVYVSATPAAYELRMSGGVVVEQIIRPTGLMDRKFSCALPPASGRLVTRNPPTRAEPRTGAGDHPDQTHVRGLTEYYRSVGIKVCYLHSDIHTLQRTEIIRELRLGTYDVWWASTAP